MRPRAAGVSMGCDGVLTNPLTGVRGSSIGVPADTLARMGRPLAYFLSWRGYGTWLHGDPRLSVDKQHAEYGTPLFPRNSAIESYERGLLTNEPHTMSGDARGVVLHAVEGHAKFRGWPILALNVRTNHVHVVVRADGTDPEPVMAQFKARATRLLREAGLAGRDQRLWAHHGSTRHLFDGDSLALAIDYVLNRQD